MKLNVGVGNDLEPREIAVVFGEEGSPALLMMGVDSRPGPTVKQREIHEPSPHRAVLIIKSAGEPMYRRA